MKTKRIMGFFLALVIFMGCLPLNTIKTYAAEGDVAIDKANFPNDYFRYYVKNFDTNPHDGKLSQTELNSVTEIWIGNRSVSSLKGIEHFKNLTYLECYSNHLTSLDLSKNTKLTKLYCKSNKLKSLDLSKNINLRELDCNNNYLKKLDVSKNTELTKLYCNDNYLTSLDFSNNTKLSELTCEHNYLTSLDFSKNEKLTELNCLGNKLTSLVLGENTNLTYLQCYNNKLDSLDLRNNTKLEILNCTGNKLKSLDLSKNTKLYKLYCNGNNLTSLDLSKNIKLSQLTCSGNNLKSLDLSKNTNLEILDCNKNNLTSLDLSKNTNLEELNAPKNPLVSIRLVRKEDAISSTYGCCFDLTPAQYTVKVKKGSKKVPFNKLPQGFDKNKIIESDVKLEEDGFTWDGSTNPIKFRYKFCENPNEVENPEIADAGAEITVTEIEFDPEHVESMVVKKQPKLIYTEGEKLDLSELVVTLTDNQGLTKDVAFKDFKENNITANPENETELKLADSGKKVTLTKGNLTAQTNALTVKTKVTPSPLPTPTDPPVVRPVDPTDPNGGKPADTSKYWTVTFKADPTKGIMGTKNTFYVLKNSGKTLADLAKDAPKVTAKPGFKFTGWEPALDANTTINKDMTVNAKFEKVTPTPTDPPVDPKDPPVDPKDPPVDPKDPPVVGPEDPTQPGGKSQVANNKVLPKTASSMNIELYTIFMILSGALLVVAFKRKKESQ